MATKQGKRSSKAAKKTSARSHIASSLFSVAPHSHTGKKLQTHHTSHGFLLLILLFTGVLLFANLGTLRAYGLSNGTGATISVTVNGAAPTTGAKILFPAPNQLTKSSLLEVSGSCPADTLVAIYNNSTFAGSTTCSSSGDFAVTVQLLEGINTLQAQNYDALNQPGPVTPQVSIFYQPDAVVMPSEPTTPIVVSQPDQLEPAPTIPAVPITVPQPSSQPCYDLPNDKATSSTKTPIISVNCIQRNLFIGDTLSLNVLIHGGVAPYALFIDWGDTQSDLKSISDNTIHSFDHVYQTSGFHKIILSTTDSQGVKSQIQSIVSINGVPATGGSAQPAEAVNDNIVSALAKAPIPLYIAAVALVLGFWVGDLFQRLVLNKNPTKRKTKRL